MQQEFLTFSQENWLHIHNKFALCWNFPHCVGGWNNTFVILVWTNACYLFNGFLFNGNSIFYPIA